MRTSVFAFGAISLAASLAIATPAYATASVDVVPPCSNLTDGVASSCHFSGNISDEDNNGHASYTNTEAAYNTYVSDNHLDWGTLTLTPLATFDSVNGGNVADGSSGGITLDMTSSSGGTFSIASGVNLEYYAVKSGNEFLVYEYDGSTNMFTTAGLGNGNNLPGLSHIVFFGTMGGVPEPATWAMMLLGIGMIGAGARRRRQSQSRSLVLS